jgi:hypothetical protein
MKSARPVWVTLVLNGRYLSSDSSDDMLEGRSERATTTGTVAPSNPPTAAMSQATPSQTAPVTTGQHPPTAAMSEATQSQAEPGASARRGDTSEASWLSPGRVLMTLCRLRRSPEVQFDCENSSSVAMMMYRCHSNATMVLSKAASRALARDVSWLSDSRRAINLTWLSMTARPRSMC